jgi:hypothetical protein
MNDEYGCEYAYYNEIFRANGQLVTINRNGRRYKIEIDRNDAIEADYISMYGAEDFAKILVSMNLTEYEWQSSINALIPSDYTSKVQELIEHYNLLIEQKK